MQENSKLPSTSKQRHDGKNSSVQISISQVVISNQCNSVKERAHEALVRYRMTSYSVGTATPKTQFYIGLHETSCQLLLATSTLPDVGQTSQLCRVLVQSRVVPVTRSIQSLGDPVSLFIMLITRPPTRNFIDPQKQSTSCILLPCQGTLGGAIIILPTRQHDCW